MLYLSTPIFETQSLLHLLPLQTGQEGHHLYSHIKRQKKNKLQLFHCASRRITNLLGAESWTVAPGESVEGHRIS